MGNDRVRFVATAFAATVLAVSVVVAQSPSGVQRPVRALGAGGDSDADAVSVDVTDVGVARPIEGRTARAHSVRLGRGYTSVPSSRSWSTRELFLGEEDGEERKPGANMSVGRSDSTDDVERPLGGGGTAIALGTGFAGLRQTSNGGPNTWSVPPDTVGDVGTTVYVQAVNTVFAVYDKATGARVFGPASQSDLYSPVTQSVCASHDDGDPIVVYDETADRFVLSQFALFDFDDNIHYECIAVSQDGDPSDGDWHAYQFEYPIGALNDYPKFGVWPDGYYASFNQFRMNAQGNFVWRGAGAIAYERSAMLDGDPAQQIYMDLFGVRSDLGGLLPSDWDSPDAPPAGMPNLYAMFDADDAFWGYSDDQVELWAFDADFAVPGNSTFTQLDLSNNPENGVDVGNFSPWVCGAPKLACIPQKNSSVKLDAISDRLMNRLQYWNDGSTQHLVVNHTVKSNDGGSAVRWYDFENLTQDPGSEAWEVGDQGTFGPGTLSRWMGSAAMNDAGDLAIGYSTSSKRKFPGIGVAARTSADPAQTLGDEAKFYTGNGSEKGSFNRWGDYSALSVDPTDHCTFWYTQQYYAKTGQWKWATRIQPFTVSSCV